MLVEPRTNERKGDEPESPKTPWGGANPKGLVPTMLIGDIQNSIEAFPVRGSHRANATWGPAAGDSRKGRSLKGKGPAASLLRSWPKPTLSS
jgi:hypothetical protein